MKPLLQVLMSLLLALAIISSSVLIVLHFRPLYYVFLESPDIKNLYSLTTEEMKENYDTLIDYNSSFTKKELSLPHLPSSPSGLIHFEEVRDIFIVLHFVALGSFFFIILLDRLSSKKMKRRTYLFSGGLFSLSLVAAVSLFILVDFSKAFVLFHKIAFQNDLWIFDYELDPIILYLPESFFMTASLSIVGFILFFSLLAIFISFFLKKSEERKGRL